MLFPDTRFFSKRQGSKEEKNGFFDRTQVQGTGHLDA
jgi:hypothetical protein